MNVSGVSAAIRPPVIVIGMHRSGTSMVVRMLQLLGVFTGWELDANGEAVYFVRRNQAVLAAQGASWDRPAPIDELLAHEAMRSRLVATLQQGLSRPAVASYLGPRHFLRYRTPLRLDRPWGWKDPRNALLLRLWLEIFPAARVVHVVRNGVDVALSLAEREQSRLDYVLANDSGARTLLRHLPNRPGGCSRTAWIYSQVRLRRAKERLARKFFQLRVPAVIDPVCGLALWEAYLSRAADGLRDVAGSVIRVRYEDVLRDPAGSARSLALHCGIEPRADRLAAAAGAVDPSRARQSANRRGSASVVPETGCRELREHARRSRWSRELGYEDPGVGDLLR